jgi:hypothetical protein
MIEGGSRPIGPGVSFRLQGFEVGGEASDSLVGLAFERRIERQEQWPPNRHLGGAVRVDLHAISQDA